MPAEGGIHPISSRRCAGQLSPETVNISVSIETGIGSRIPNKAEKSWETPVGLTLEPKSTLAPKSVSNLEFDLRTRKNPKRQMNVNRPSYIKTLQKSRALPKGARRGVVPKSTYVNCPLAGAGDGRYTDDQQPRSIQRCYAAPANLFIPTGHGRRITGGMVMRCARQML